MVFQFRTGYRANVTATIAGERLAAIERANGGNLTAQTVVDDARPEEAPLHPVFEWDDAEAAERYREDQARRLIRNVFCVVKDEAGDSRPILHHVHVTLPDVGPCYVTTARAMSDADLRAQVEADALNAFEALRHRYQHIQSLAPIFAAIEATQAKAKAKAKVKGNAKANANHKRPARVQA